MENTATIASQELLSKQFDETDWDDLWIKLTARCVYLFKRRYSVSWRHDVILQNSRDIISTVIAKIFVDQTRNWNLDEYPDFVKFIQSVIDSDVNNFINKKKKELLTDDDSFLESRQDKSVNIENRLSADELNAQIYSIMEDANATDEELLILDCMFQGIIKKADIQSELGIDENEFKNLWRRFKKKREIIKTKLAENGY